MRALSNEAERAERATRHAVFISDDFPLRRLPSPRGRSVAGNDSLTNPKTMITAALKTFVGIFMLLTLTVGCGTKTAQIEYSSASGRSEIAAAVDTDAAGQVSIRTPEAPRPTLDPASLIGECSGQLTAAKQYPIHLAINATEGNSIIGTLRMTVDGGLGKVTYYAERNKDLPIRGLLVGDTITIRTDPGDLGTTYVLAVKGRRMSGRVIGFLSARPAIVELTCRMPRMELPRD